MPYKKINSRNTTSSIPESQEKTRAWIAKVIVIICGMVIMSQIVLIYFEKKIESSIISTASGMLGFVLGFYFNNKE